MSQLTPATPFNVDILQLELCQLPDRAFVSYLCTGLHNGFDTMTSDAQLTNLENKSHMSARKILLCGAYCSWYGGDLPKAFLRPF